MQIELHAGSSGSHRSRMSSKLLSRLHEDSVLELLLVMAQHTSRVTDRCCPVTVSSHNSKDLSDFMNIMAFS